MFKDEGCHSGVMNLVRGGLFYSKLKTAGCLDGVEGERADSVWAAAV
jgi:hypothetical protein